MKILYVINSLDIGGAEKMLVDIVENLKMSNHSIGVYLLRSKKTFLLNRLRTLNVSIFISNISCYSPIHIYNIVNCSRNFDIIHSNLFPSLYWVSIASLFMKNTRKFVYTEHSTYNRRRKKKWLCIIEKIIYNRYHKIIAISSETKQNLSYWIGMSHKIEVIENAIDVYKYRNASAYDRRKMNIKSDVNVILMSARFSTAKDQETLIKAFSLLNFDNIALVLVGDGPLKAECEVLVSQLGIASSTYFLGMREDIPQLIKMADICVLSSHWEGFGLVAVEYMAAGKPVVASDVAGLNNVVKGAGILFKAGDEKELAANLSQLIVDVEYKNKISTACLKRSDKYELSKMVGAYLNVYNSL